MNRPIEQRIRMIQEKWSRVYQTFKDVRMDILGEIRHVEEVKLSMTSDGRWSISFDEYNRIADIIHHQLRRKRKVYSSHD